MDAQNSTQPSKVVTLSLLETPNARARSFIAERLDAFNDAYTGVSDNIALDVLLIDETDEVLGGLVGRTSLGVLFVHYVFVPENLRGNKYGTRMMEMAEAEAMRRGCKTSVLFTMVFQAPSFYEKNGYVTFGRVECNPPSNARIFMRKNLLQ